MAGEFRYLTQLRQTGALGKDCVDTAGMNFLIGFRPRQRDYRTFRLPRGVRDLRAVLYSQVAQAASRFAADWKNHTIDTVCEALGTTGSESTIGPMPKRWETEHQETAIGVELGLPVELVYTDKGLHK